MERKWWTLDAFVTALNEILLVAAVILLAGATIAFLTVRARDFVAPSGPPPGA